MTYKNMNNLQMINTVNKNEEDIVNLSSQLGDNVQQLNGKIDEVAKKGTTTEVLTRVTQEEIDKKIKNGQMANLTIENDSITKEKYKNKSITNSKIDDNGIYKNRGLTFPLDNINIETSNTEEAKFIKNGILDIKVLDAKKDLNYSLKYVGVNNATFQDLILVDAINLDGTRAYSLFDTIKVEYPTNGLQTHFLKSKNSQETVVITIDYSVCNTDIYNFNLEYIQGFGNIISKQCIYLKDENPIERNRVLMDELMLNKGVDYPLVINPKADGNFLRKGLLDIKIKNAIKDVEYQFQYITKNQDEHFGDLILIKAKNKSGVNIRHLFDTKKVIYDIKDRNGISKLNIKADNGNEEIEILFDYSVISDGFIPTTTESESNEWKANVVHPTKLFINDEDIMNNNQLTLEWNKESSRLVVNIGNTSLSFYKGMPNSLMALYSGNVNGVNFGGGSDIIGPYIVKAVNNGVEGGIYYTGGTHSKTNSMEGEPTARTLKIKLLANGNPIYNTGTIKANSFDLYVTNEIMAYNTSKIDRYVMKEIVHYHMEGEVLTVQVDIVPKEEIIIDTYYGQQMVNGGFNKIIYMNGADDTELPSINATNGSGSMQDNFNDSFLLFNDKAGILVKLDRTVGLGTMEYLGGIYEGSFTRSYGKSYHCLAMGNTKPINERVFWKGSYTFGSK